MRDLGIQNSKRSNKVTQQRKRTHYRVISINEKKKKEERRRSSSSRRRRCDRQLFGQSAGCCFNWAQTLFRCVLLLPFSFFFSFFFFLRNLSSSSLVLFFFPYKYLCSRSEIIRSPFDLCSSSCSFISSRSNHNFIPVCWPKFTEKAETKRNRSNLKNRSRFTKPDGRTAVRAGPCFFGMKRFFTLNKP